MHCIGVDLVEIARLGRMLNKSETLAKRIFSSYELDMAEKMSAGRRLEYLAGRFATKEAVLKALQLGIVDTSMLREIEVLPDFDGSPALRLSGALSRLTAEVGLSDWKVSISHDAGVAAAFVLLS